MIQKEISLSFLFFYYFYFLTQQTDENNYFAENFSFIQVISCPCVWIYLANLIIYILLIIPMFVAFVTRIAFFFLILPSAHYARIQCTFLIRNRKEAHWTKTIGEYWNSSVFEVIFGFWLYEVVANYFHTNNLDTYPFVLDNSIWNI